MLFSQKVNAYVIQVIIETLVHQFVKVKILNPQFIKIILVCDTTCLTCSNAGSTSCTTCNTNAFLSTGQCICNSGYYRDSNTSFCIGRNLFNQN